MNTQAIVKKSTGSNYEVVLPNSEVVFARIKGKLRLNASSLTNPVAVGDRVEMEWDKKSQIWVINKILERNNYLIRKSNNLSKQAQIIASNIDYALIFISLIQPRTSFGFIDRIITTLEAYSIEPIIIVNKTDLYQDSEELMEQLYQLLGIYDNLGYKVFPISTINKVISNDLVDMIIGKTVLLVGHSGVGKSSFLRFLSPNSLVKIGDISNANEKGKHTTTFAEMHIIDNKFFIIDSPGIKDFGIVDIKPQEIAQYFPEFRKFQGLCKFSNCLHINEPNCAIIEKINSGEIDIQRYYSYLSMVEGNDKHH